MKTDLSTTTLNTIFHECRQCGTCCKKYNKILLQPDEVEYIEKMGGHVGVNVSLAAIREEGAENAIRKAKEDGKVYMIHPDEGGCVFLEKRNDKYYCKLYHYRPQTCRGYRCNLADNSMMSLFSSDAIYLLGKDKFGLPMENKG